MTHLLFTSCQNLRHIRWKSTRVADTFTLNQGTTINIQGWVKSIRKMKDLIFIDLIDGSCCSPLQVLFPKERRPFNLSNGSSVSIVGKLQENPKGQKEIMADEVNVIGGCDPTQHPFTPKQKLSPDYTRQFLHFRPSLNHFSALLRIRHETAKSVRQFFDQNNFLEINTPVLTSNDCEGAGEIFQVVPSCQNLVKAMKKEGKTNDEAFFNTKAYLTVSGQLQLEAAARSLTRVYTFGPTFRAENSKSRLHLSEFYMIEAEQAFIESIEDVLNIIESLIKEMSNKILNVCEKDIEIVLNDNKTDVKQQYETINKIIKNKFIIISYDEAFNILNKNKNKFKSNVEYNEGLTKEHELFLVHHNDNVPVFVINWPKGTKPFYMRDSKTDTNRVDAVDLLVPNVGELCGGSLREDDYFKLEEKLKQNSLLSSLDWYLKLRKFGNVPTGGFGMGFERYLQFLLNIGNIKDTIPFPRWPHNLSL